MVFEADNELGEITGLYMNDEEGTIETVDVQAKFVNGNPEAIECKHVMRSALEWDRFMRFMERYAEGNELGFSAVRACQQLHCCDCLTSSSPLHSGAAAASNCNASRIALATSLCPRPPVCQLDVVHI